RHTMQQPHRQALAVGATQIEIECLGSLQARCRLDRLYERHAFASNQVGNGKRTRNKLGQVYAEPVGKSCVDVEDLALPPGREEAGGGMVKIIDGVLKLPEEP